MLRTSLLSNGIRLLTERIPHALSVSAGAWILRGSRNEPAKWSGITHFVEHMLFKGTERRSSLDISREIESVGGSLNAFTGKEFTCIYARVLSKHLALGVDLIADIFLHAVFPEEELEKERQVILQEIHMVEDSPEEFVHELFTGSYWRGHPLGRSTLGTPESVGSFDRSVLASYAGVLRDPSRIVLTLAGNLEHEEVLRLAECHFALPPPRDNDLSQEKPAPHKGLEIHLKELEQVHLCLGTLGYPYADERRHGYHVLNTLLGGGMSSRLFQEIRERRGLAYSVYSFQSSYCDSGLLGVYAGIGRDSVLEVVQLLVQILVDLKDHPVSAEELRTAKEQLKGNLLLSTESTSNRMSKLAMNEVYFGKQLDIDEVIHSIDRVNEEEVRAVSRDLFRSEYLSLTILGDVDREALAEIRLDL
jgi:predicted Zn-dependent peptidase